jgi:hypothetical protein
MRRNNTTANLANNYATEGGILRVLQSQDEKEQKYLSELYNIYKEIESKFLTKQSREVDKAESLVLFTRNQFLRELKRTMDNDQALTLKYQMIGLAKLFNNNLNFINSEWDYVEKVLRHLNVNNYIAEEST